MKPRSLIQGALALCTAALIAGCSQSPAAPNAQAEAYRPAYILSVPVTAGDTARALEARYGGKVVELNAGAGFAILGLDATAAKTQNLRAQALGDAPVAEPNLNQFQAGAVAQMARTRTMWAGGEWQAARTRTMWAGGTYAPVVENTGTFKQIMLEKAHLLAPNLGAGVKVAVIDTGLDLNHAAFVGALAPEAERWDYVGNDAVPQEEGAIGVGGYGHGTAVASIILQVAPRATILPLRVLDSNGEGDTDNVARAIGRAVSMKARIINLSLGSTTRSDTVQNAIKAATEAGVLVVSSAGNENAPSITYPAADATVKGKAGEYSLSVTSVDGLNLKSSFSNYSSAVEVGAPGEDIFTAGPDNLLVSWSGTSMSAPLASGGLALALGQTLAVDIKDVTKKMAENGLDLYKDSLNSAYKDKLGKRRLDLELFLKNTVK